MEPTGKCQCGCGRTTEISTKSRPDRGIVRGQPNMFIRGHSSSKRGAPVVSKGFKWCAVCKRVKRLSEFHRNKSSKSGVCTYCKSCGNWHSALWRDKNPDIAAKSRDKHLFAARYGIGQPDYEILLNGQAGVCAICRKPVSGRRRLDVDHDHKTGKVRGLLCRSCNFVVGYAHDDKTVLQRAAAYLEKFESSGEPARLRLVGDNDHDPENSGIVVV